MQTFLNSFSITPAILSSCPISSRSASNLASFGKVSPRTQLSSSTAVQTIAPIRSMLYVHNFVRSSSAISVSPLQGKKEGFEIRQFQSFTFEQLNDTATVYLPRLYQLAHAVAPVACFFFLQKHALKLCMQTCGSWNNPLQWCILWSTAIMCNLRT